MTPAIINTSRFLQKNLLWLLILAYALGAIWPGFGLWIRGTPSESGGWILKVMLAVLLLNAGLGCDTRQLRRLSSKSTVLLTSLGASLLVPLLYVLCIAATLSFWTPTGRWDQILLGLAVVAAMPAAASSTAWAHNTDGDLALSLGLLLISTLVGPAAAPVILRMATGQLHSLPPDDLASLVSGATAVFLAIWVVLPASCGIVLRDTIGGGRVDPLKPYLKLSNLAILLVLNYANASLALPSLLASPQPRTLVLVAATTFGLAVVAFGVALPVARLHGVEASQRASLLFGMGMKNNGAGLVLVATAMVQPGPVLLPIIFYNLVQHFGAGVVSRCVMKKEIQADSRPAGDRDSGTRNGRRHQPAHETVAGR
jgi:BASS family bile acid:Na+ symporter